MKGWLIPALIALAMWGFWGFLPKLATRTIDPKSAMIYQALGNVLFAVIVLAILGFHPQFHTTGALWAILTGVFGMIGSLFFLIAVSRGRISVVAAVTALYPLLSILLAATFLHEPVTLKQGIGFVFALTSIVLLSV